VVKMQCYVKVHLADGKLSKFASELLKNHKNCFGNC